MDLALDIDRAQGRPWRSFEGRLQRCQHPVLDRQVIDVQLVVERVEDFRRTVHAVAGFHPAVEQGSEPRRPIRLFGHRTAERGGNGCRVGHVVLESRGWHPARQIDNILEGEPTAAFFEQQVEVVFPFPGLAGDGGAHEFGGALHGAASIAQRIERPGEDVHVFSERVLLQLGFARQRADHADIGKFAQKQARPAWRFLGCPKRCAEQQRMPRPRDGDIGESALLPLEMLPQLCLELGKFLEKLLARLGLAPGEFRKLCGVPAELVWKLAERKPGFQPAFRLARQLVFDHSRNHDEIPFEPLRAVDGEQLYRARFGILGPGC